MNWIVAPVIAIKWLRQIKKLTKHKIDALNRNKTKYLVFLRPTQVPIQGQ